MKNLLRNHYIDFDTACIAIFVFGQDVIRQVSCFDSTLKREADSLKASLSKQGFVVVREATMTMESEYEMPVIVPLT